MYWDIHCDGPFGIGYKIYVDGKEIPNVVEFDMDDGWVRAFKLDEDGEIVVCDTCNDVVTELHQGQVTLQGPE